MPTFRDRITPKRYEHYWSTETEKLIAGTADLYYGYSSYHHARNEGYYSGRAEYYDRADWFFNRVHYIIPKDEDGNLTHLTLIDQGRVLNVCQEIENGLDRITIAHLWRGDPYRFNHVHIEPIGRVQWIAPDVFYWEANSPLNEKVA